MSRWIVVVCLLLGVLSGCTCKKQNTAAKVEKIQPLPREDKAKSYEPPPARLPRGVRLRPEEVWVNGGSFFMGTSNDEIAKGPQKSGRYLVTLSRMFAMWRFEVTQDEYKTKMGYNPSSFLRCGGSCPVERVTWSEAAAFCNKLSEEKGLMTCFLCEGRGRNVLCRARPEFLGSRYYQCSGYRLPTEAEWEKAARAGSSESLYVPAISKEIVDGILPHMAWFFDNNRVLYKEAFSCALEGSKERFSCGTHSVGSKEPNLLGLYDMLGNVSEWVFDGFGAYPTRPVKDPAGVVGSKVRVQRGGSWFTGKDNISVNRRFWAFRSSQNKLTGFRPVRTLWLAAPEK